MTEQGHRIDPLICSIHGWHGETTCCPWCSLGITQPVAGSSPTNWIGTPAGVLVDANGRPITDPRFRMNPRKQTPVANNPTMEVEQ